MYNVRLNFGENFRTYVENTGVKWGEKFEQLLHLKIKKILLH